MSLRGWVRPALLVGASYVFMACLFASPARAQSADDVARSTARELATEGSELYRAGDYAGAYDRFQRAFEVVHVPTLGVWAARSLAKQGRLVQAGERYREVERLTLPPDAPDAHKQALTDAKTEREQLALRVPSIVVKLEGASVDELQIVLDDRAFPAALVGVKNLLDPGTHKVRAVRGEETAEQSFVLKEAETKTVILAFKTADAAPIPTQDSTPSQPPSTGAGVGQDEPPSGGNKTLGYVAIAAGGALLVGGAVTGVIALGQQGDLDKHCPGGECEPAYHGDVDSYDTMKLFSTIGLVGGAVIGGVGVYLVLSSGSSSPSAEMSAKAALPFGARPERPSYGVRILPNHVAFSGTF
jgi:hypothetical protein